MFQFALASYANDQGTYSALITKRRQGKPKTTYFPENNLLPIWQEIYKYQVTGTTRITFVLPACRELPAVNITRSPG